MNAKLNSIFATMSDISHDFYMKRCLELAELGLGSVSPNPLVGSVIVYNQEIIGEGYHEKFGDNHAEVNAINSVKNKELLTKSTLYVNLEPCSHHGKTPPCSDLIIRSGIPKVVVGTVDPFPQVSGRGVQKLRKAGIEVITGVLKNECKWLNRRFFKTQLHQKPWVILKWAQTFDDFIAPHKTGNFKISNEIVNRVVHKWRSEEDSILVGYNTVNLDNPGLTTRLFPGKNPIRIILDHENTLRKTFKVFKSEAKTLVFTSKLNEEVEANRTEIYLNSDLVNDIESLLKLISAEGIQSVIVEGGSKTLQKFISQNQWDEARVIISEDVLIEGVKAPQINKKPNLKEVIENNTLYWYKNA